MIKRNNQKTKISELRLFIREEITIISEAMAFDLLKPGQSVTLIPDDTMDVKGGTYTVK